MIRETGRTHHFTQVSGKPISEGYKIFSIGDEGYLYNYAWYSPVQGLEGRPKVKNLAFKLVTDTLPSGIILFMDNYFTEPKLTGALKAEGIAVCGTMKQT